MTKLGIEELSATSGGMVVTFGGITRAVAAYLWKNWFTPQA